MGSLVSLVAHYDNIDYDDAEEMICGISSFSSLIQKVDEFFGHKTETFVTETVEEPEGLQLPDFTFYIDKMSDRSIWKSKAQVYLAERKIPTEGLYVCTENKKYGNRIVIPWFDKNEKMTFWNARLMSNKKDVLRYAKPEKVDQNKALFTTEWPALGNKMYIMEGELDAISLQVAGLYGCACGGKYLSQEQIDMLRGYIPVLAFDTDESGLKALIDTGKSLLENGFPVISYIRPPAAYKDWNKFLQQRDAQTVRL